MLAGFRWQDFRKHEIAHSKPLPPFDRDVAIVTGSLQRAVRYRIGLARRARVHRRLAGINELLRGSAGPVCLNLRTAANQGDVEEYETALAALVRLHEKQSISDTRRRLLGRLKLSAPPWTSAIARRDGPHGCATPPGDPETAWKWVQLSQEITRRSELDERALAALCTSDAMSLNL